MKYYIFTILFLGINSLGFSQTFPNAVYALFQDIETKGLPIYAAGNVASSSEKVFLPTSLYPFKGTPIAEAYTTEIRKILGVADKYVQFHAVYRLSISTNTHLLLIRVYHENYSNNRTSIYGIFCDAETKQVKGSRLLAYDETEEGRDDKLESWLVDLNGDKQLDILSRSELQIYDLEFTTTTRQVKTLFWKNNAIATIEIVEATLKNALEKNFPFHKAVAITYDNQQQLTEYFNKNR